MRSHAERGSESALGWFSASLRHFLSLLSMAYGRLRLAKNQYCRFRAGMILVNRATSKSSRYDTAYHCCDVGKTWGAFPFLGRNHLVTIFISLNVDRFSQSSTLDSSITPGLVISGLECFTK